MNEQNIHPFERESAFELALCHLLSEHGWSSEVLVQPTEEELVENWAGILFDMNREQERLGNCPLTPSEMQQIIDQVNMCASPYKDGSTIVDKFVAFNLLVTKFEAYLKKLFYLMKNREVQPMRSTSGRLQGKNEGERLRVGEHRSGMDVTWANVIHDVKPLWQLKYSTDESKQRLYQWLLMVKEWRNSESHISPTATEQELNAAISIITTMYCYATGSCITDLEMNGHYVDDDYEPMMMAAEPGPESWLKRI